jgi:hypothetical protein
MHKYSDKLVQRIITYFAKVHDHHIDEETANEYLDSLGGLFAIFAEHEEKNQKETIKT